MTRSALLPMAPQEEARRDIPDSFLPPHQADKAESSVLESAKRTATVEGMFLCPSGHSSSSLPFPIQTPGNVKGLGKVQTPSRSNAVLIKQKADVRSALALS